MSSTELHTGTAIEMAKEVKGLYCKLRHLNINVDDMDREDLADGYLSTDIPYTYIKDTDRLFYLQNHVSRSPEDYLLEGTVDELGAINFTLMFYNGGCGFDEMFEDLVNKLEKATSEN